MGEKIDRREEVNFLFIRKSKALFSSIYIFHVLSL